MRAWILATTLPLSSLLAGAAAADVAPPPDYVESCTVANSQQPGRIECLSCGESYFGAPTACRDKHAAAGYELRCKTRGASTWGEVWCRPIAPVAATATTGAPVPPGPAPAPMEPAVPPPPPEKAGSCGACDLGARGRGSEPSLALLVAAAVLAGRRRPLLAADS
jgi:hypothetical protein